MPTTETATMLERLLTAGGPSYVLAFGAAALMLALAALVTAYAARLGVQATRSLTEHRERRRMAPSQDVAGHGGAPRLVLQDEVKRIAEALRQADRRMDDLAKASGRLQAYIRAELERRDIATVDARKDQRDRLERIEQLLDGVLKAALTRGGGQ